MKNPDHPRSKRTLRQSSNCHASMSDSDSTISQPDSFHSPLQWDSPFRSDDPSFQPENDNNNKNSRSQVPYYPAPSPDAAGAKSWHLWLRSEKHHDSDNADCPASGGGNDSRRDKYVSETNHDNAPVVLRTNRLLREEGYGGGREAAVGGERPAAAALRRVRMRRAALIFRVFEMVVCLISFAVMAADKTQGWSGDSYDRYTEYRYCLAVNIIGFAYSGFQALSLVCHLSTGMHVIPHHFRLHFDFSMDQILAYLVVSASSCAATRVMDWISNWGKDDFTLLASASIAMSFLAFIAFACSSVISGYNLCCNQDSSPV